MEQRIQDQTDENNRLEQQLNELKNDDFSEPAIGTDIEELKKKLLGAGAPGDGESFPEDFLFRQNDFRSEDLEVEERALLNLIAQEYDHLRVISRLPTNSEMYRFKMDQYKELSQQRNEIEKVLQEQRLEKIRRDFEREKFEDERRMKHEKWLED